MWPNGVPQTLNPDDAAHGAVTAAQHHATAQTPTNASGEVEVTRGDIAVGFAQADLVLENTYRTQIVHQGYLETQTSIAQPDSVSGEITIYRPRPRRSSRSATRSPKS